MTGFAQTADEPPSAANARMVVLRRQAEVPGAGVPGAGAPGIVAGSYSYEGTHPVAPWHRHDLHQLEYAFEGVVEVRTAAARYRLPSLQAAWIPAGLAHVSTFDRARTASVLFDPALVRDSASRVRVLPVEPVLREMIIYAARWPIGRPDSDAVADSYFGALADLVLERLDRELPFHLPVSHDPLITDVMRYTDTRLADVSIAAVCRAVATSERTLRRRFGTATGMTWRQYLLHSRLLHAMTLLVRQDSTVLAVATAVGFDSASAFSRAFHAYTGQTPTAFRHDRV